MWPNAIPGLAYDMAAAVVEAISRATILTGPGVKTGLERIRFMPACTGGPNTHIAGGPVRPPDVQGRLAPLRPSAATGSSSSPACTSPSTTPIESDVEIGRVPATSSGRGIEGGPAS